MPAEIPPFAEPKSTNKDNAKFVISRADYAKIARPRFFIVGGDSFDFPLGAQGFDITGSPTLAIHKYVGDKGAVVQVIHQDERHIELSGNLPGDTGPENMRRLLRLLIQPDPTNDFKRLELPGIFAIAVPVVVENYRFSHAEDDYTQSIDYNCSFIRAVPSTGNRSDADLSAPTPSSSVTASPPAPGATPRGGTSRQYAVSDAFRTLRSIAAHFYGNADAWKQLYDLNISVLTAEKTWAPADVPPLHQMPTKPLPLGLVLNY